jgi:asparagine synthase (glutamine-hydrolysing)
MTLRYDPLKPNTKLIKHITYDSLKDRTKPYPSLNDIESHLRKIIRKNVLDLNPSSISLALSSGIDSNLILSLLSAEFPSIKLDCITVTFDEYSESKTAKKIVEDYPSSAFHEVIVDNPLRDLPFLISIVKEPRWNLYQYYFLKKAKDFSNIIFTGDGGDELFGGYTFRYQKFLDNFNYKLNWRDRVRLYLDCHDRDWVPDQNTIFDSSLQFDWERIYSLLKIYFDNDLSPLDQVFMADYYGKLMHDFVPTQKKFLDLFNLIGVTPILDPSIIDLSTKMPPSTKYNYRTNKGKIPLRKIPLIHKSENIAKNKRGFSLDLRNLWIKSGKEIVTSNLDKGQIFEGRIVRRDFYTRSLKRIEETLDVRYISKLLQLLSLEVWYKMFVTLEISSKNKL